MRFRLRSSRRARLVGAAVIAIGLGCGWASGWIWLGAVAGVALAGLLLLHVELEIRRSDLAREHAEVELRHAQKLESVGRLAAGVAHEINTPIQFVADSVGFVRDSIQDLVAIAEHHQRVARAVVAGDPQAIELARAALAEIEHRDYAYLVEEIPQALDRALQGIERVAVIVRSMRQFAHSSASMTSTDINAALASTITIARNEYKYVADLETDYGELPAVTCHAGEINQVFLNVLLNGADAIADRVKRGGGRGRLAVTTRRSGDDVVITISDTGCGIPDTLRERIFDPFFTTKELGKGTGQGLAIARTVVVDKHHGSISFDSEVGRGTTFTIRIPIVPRGHTATQQEQAA